MSVKVIVKEYQSNGAQLSRSPISEIDGSTRRAYSVIIGVPGQEETGLELSDFRLRVSTRHFILEQSPVPIFRGVTDTNSPNHRNNLRKNSYVGIGAADFVDEFQATDTLRSRATLYAMSVSDATGLGIHHVPYEHVPSLTTSGGG